MLSEAILFKASWKYYLDFARVGGFHMPRRRDFAVLNKAFKGEAIVAYAEPLITQLMKASGSPRCFQGEN